MKEERKGKVKGEKSGKKAKTKSNGKVGPSPELRKETKVKIVTKPN